MSAESAIELYVCWKCNLTWSCLLKVQLNFMSAESAI